MQFGKGLSARDYVIARLSFAVSVAELEGSDGWHDASVHPDPEHEALDKILEDCILEASLGVGGAISATTPYYTGLVDAVAAELGGPEPRRSAAVIDAHRRFLARAIENLRKRGVEL